jgi:hypothetical protein
MVNLVIIGYILKVSQNLGHEATPFWGLRRKCHTGRQMAGKKYRKLHTSIGLRIFIVLIIRLPLSFASFQMRIVMLSTRNLSAAQAENYFVKDDYYTKGAQHEASFWLGKGAQNLGFTSLCKKPQALLRTLIQESLCSPPAISSTDL